MIMTSPIMDDLIAVEDYVATAIIGRGSNSTVWKAKHRTSGQVVALKQVPLCKLTRNLRDSLDCEVTFLSSVNHPNIIHLLDVFKADGCVFLVLEFCAGGNLASYIKLHGRVDEQLARNFMRQLGAGLKVLNTHHIIHRDLKPENILLLGTQNDLVLKIADFGLSRILHPNNNADTVCGSPFYMAPEILGFQPYDEKVDMWSLGIILFELLHGYPPYRGRTNVQLLQNIRSSTCLPFSELVLTHLQPHCVDICSRLLCVNPGNRFSFDEFYHHEFLRT
ncbi:serine/threonine-protein kinase ATG1t [Impatiens glandulifera]|uniref:serine/threonine-protein kinase ATG1t n=1 Tax=Impatiens glandulifera TaxID=253017 RepID=UPI001FB07280|nr:serine/threonine-protein kinase ATG1t [Impatiens glandulifera]XP_047319134.1 serine/threonine-protein kinase ATG1t [Impatiens glandulifera]